MLIKLLKNIITYLLLFIFSFLYKFSQGQQTNCENLCNEIISILEKNYAGIIDIKKNKVKKYIKEKKTFFAATKKNQFDIEFYLAIKKYLKFFMDPHLSIGFNYKSFPKETISFFKENPAQKCTEINKNTESSIWIDDSKRYTINLYDINDSTKIGCILKGDSMFWNKNDIKVKLHKKKEKWEATYYLRDHEEINEQNTIVAENYIKIGKYVRYTNIESNKKEKRELIFLDINDSINYLAIPSFTIENAAKIDSIVSAKKNLIESKKILIIDLRNNGGGSVLPFKPLLKYLGQKNLFEYGYSYMTGDLNKISLQKSSKDKIFTQEIQSAFLDIYLKTMSVKPGRLVEISPNSKTEIDSIFDGIKNIYILVNEKTASAAEKFLLLATQSKKTIVVGTPTAGATLYNDINVIPLKSIPFLQLAYPMSRSNRIDSKKNRDSKIRPDIEINLPDEDWLEVLLNIISKK